MPFRRPARSPTPLRRPGPPAPSRAGRLAVAALVGAARVLSAVGHLLGWAYAAGLWLWTRGGRRID